MLTAYSCVIDVHRFYWHRLTMALVVCVCRWFGLISRVCLLYRLTNTEKCIQTISCAQLCQIDEIIALLWTSHKSVAQYSVLCAQQSTHTHTKYLLLHYEMSHRCHRCYTNNRILSQADLCSHELPVWRWLWQQQQKMCFSIGTT